MNKGVRHEHEKLPTKEDELFYSKGARESGVTDPLRAYDRPVPRSVQVIINHAIDKAQKKHLANPEHRRRHVILCLIEHVLISKKRAPETAGEAEEPVRKDREPILR